MAFSNEIVWSDNPAWGDQKIRSEINLWWTDSGATSAVLHASGGGWTYNSDGWGGSSINLAGALSRAGGCYGNSDNLYWAKTDWYWNDVTVGTYTKGYTEQTISKSCVFTYGPKGTVTATVSIKLPAKTKYTVSYSADGGGGAPSDQDKWHDESLTLSSTTPIKLGFSFKGWSGSDGNTYQAGGSYTGNANLTLTAIWQALTTDLDAIEDIEIGQKPTFTWTPQASNLSYKIVLSLGEWTYTTGVIAPGSTSKYTYNSYTVPLIVCNQLPTQTEGLMRADLETYNGSTKTGTSTQYFTVAVPASVVPTIDMAMTIPALVNPLVDYLQNYSKVSGEVDCSKAYSSEIVSAKMVVGEEEIIGTIEPDSFDPDVIVCEFLSDILTEAGTIPITFSVTDARGRTATNTTSITVYAYEEPSAEIEITYESETLINALITPSFSSVGGRNSATISVNGGAPMPISDGSEIEEQKLSEYNKSRNYTCTAVVTDAITSVTVVAMGYSGKGNRFEALDEDQFYVGMDDKGWKDLCDYDGGIKEDGTIWFERTSGTGPVGVGIPIQMEPDKDYELFYSANNADDETVAMVAFFNETASYSRELGTTYISTTENLSTGESFHTPDGTTWGIVILGVEPSSYETIGYREFSSIILREIEEEEDPLDWEVETGNMGLNSPLQKYISKVVIRMAFEGSMKVEIAYDAGPFTEVYQKTTALLRSYDIPINVKRCDHFRFRISGTGVAKIYSIGYNEETGSEIQ